MSTYNTVGTLVTGCFCPNDVLEYIPDSILTIFALRPDVLHKFFQIGIYVVQYGHDFEKTNTNVTGPVAINASNFRIS